MFEHEKRGDRGGTQTPRSVQGPTIVYDIKQSNITGDTVRTTFFIIHNKFAAVLILIQLPA